MFRRAIPLFALLAACGTDSVLSFELISPTAGDVYDQGAPVHLEGVTTLDGLVVDAPLVWTSGEWTTTGNALDVTDLAVGVHNLGVVASWEGMEAGADLSIEVLAGPVDYAGTLTAKADVASGSFQETYDCVSDYLNFVLQPDGSFVGEGACTMDLPIIGTRTEVFTINGTADGATVSGTMTVSEAADQPTSFSGTKTDDGTISSTFDQSFTDGSGTLRLYGTFTATPQ